MWNVINNPLIVPGILQHDTFDSLWERIYRLDCLRVFRLLSPMCCYFGLIISRSTGFILRRLNQFILVIEFINSVVSFVLLRLTLFESTARYTELWSYSISVSDMIYFLQHWLREMGSIFHYCISVSWHWIERSTTLYYLILLLL